MRFWESWIPPCGRHQSQSASSPIPRFSSHISVKLLLICRQNVRRRVRGDKRGRAAEQIFFEKVWAAKCSSNQHKEEERPSRDLPAPTQRTFLATLVALHFTPVSESVSKWAEFRTSVAPRLYKFISFTRLKRFINKSHKTHTDIHSHWGLVVTSKIKRNNVSHKRKNRFDWNFTWKW